MNGFSGRLGLMQRVLPVYRKPFFDLLAMSCERGLSVFAGKPRPAEMVETCDRLEIANMTRANNHYLLAGKFSFCWQSGLIPWLEGWQPDVLIVEANPRYLTISKAVRWMKHHKRPVIGWGLGAQAGGGFPGALRGVFRGPFLKQFDAMITYSSQGAEEYREAGIAPGKIFIAPNAVAPRPNRPAHERPNLPTRKAPLIIFVGRLQARKRVNILIRACKISRHHPGLWIVGDGPERLTLERQAAEEYPDTKFWGAVHGENLDPLLDQADLFILPGTGGLALQQAMAHALPVMAAEADGTQSDLVRPSNGWMLPPGDLDGLVDRMDAALSDNRRLRMMGLESYRIVSEEINLEKMVAGFLDAVQSVWNR